MRKLGWMGTAVAAVTIACGAANESDPAPQATPAVVRRFGIVFSDVDLPDETTIQLFAQDGTTLGTFSAPVRSDAAGLSFAGVTYADAIIARVRITLGTGALGATANDVTEGGSAD